MRQLKIDKSITTRDSESLDKYLTEIGRYELLTPDEESDLAMKASRGDKEAKEKLVCSNLRFVVSVAKKYQHQGVPLCDLIDEGNIGLMTAADKFDATKGFKFISYAVWWIRQSIMLAIQEHGKTVRLPLNKTGQLNKINKAINQFEHENQRRPTTDELAKLLDEDEDKIKDVLNAQTSVSSIDAPITDDDSSTLGDVLANENSPQADKGLVLDSLRADIAQFLKNLTPKQRAIIRMSFGLDGEEKSLDEIGEEFNLSRERVRQIKELSIRKLKSNIGRASLIQYL